MARVIDCVWPAALLLVACGETAMSGSADLTTTDPAPGIGSAGASAAPGVGSPAMSAAAGGASLGMNDARGPAASAGTGVAPAPSAMDPGAAPGMQPPAADPGAAPAMGSPMGAATDGVPMQCRGFSFEGLKYSPGGSVLPNTCEPFHQTTNNPYAVRCTDVWPFYKTKYPGDNFCILPPPPDQGIQYGVHPQGKTWYEEVSAGDLSGYDNLSDEWEMSPGDEEDANYETSATNPTEMNYYRNAARMRPGSHHMIVTAGGGSGSETWGPGAPGFFSGKNVPGAQRADENAPKSLLKPTEDEGLYMRLPAMPGITFNMHHFNATSGTILKEAWTNLWWESDTRKEVLDILGLDFGQAAGLAIEPGNTVDLHYSWNVSREFRMLSIFGHRHAWTTAFTTWVEPPGGGEPNIIYASMDWFDEPTYRYDSQTMNPTADPAKKVDGAHSGILMIPAGSKIHFNCHIAYTDARAEQEGAPRPAENGTLRFANEAFTAEMCIMFGQTLDTMLLSPTADNSPVPDFAKVE